ncbi:glycosyltransferase [Candidatus Dojkabacteria bacterium]|jgi:glycosyltransferase involved in cell wall biosynthesis|nr:glycosyltransferase [Candidatus Dojkabacteria bacterium]
MASIAIIDVIGLTYDGDTLDKRGLGGSESAVILMAKELRDIGFHVTVFNNCIDSLSNEGDFSGVIYKDLESLKSFNDYTFDVVISSRTVIPFLEEKNWKDFNYSPDVFVPMVNRAKLKVVWLHDTFCSGDHLLEEMVVNGCIDEIFTLSDFHSVYVSNCDHGNRRMFEVLKNKIFLTRNGINNYNRDVIIENKDPNLFVYNSSVTKGMIPLVTKIWSRLKQHIPEAKLKIIGGFYRFRDNCEPDEQEKTFWKLYDEFNQKLGIEFTGIIKQSEIADILTDASFMLYPAAFPETFGISALESLNYNTPLITCRFGALEETAIEECSYFIDYPIEPNNLFHNVNSKKQIDKFIDLTLKVYNDKYLHQQKMYNCNIVKEYSGWDSVAIQWKQHIFNKLHKNLSVQDYREVDKINRKIHKIFGRRFSNKEEWTEQKNGVEQRIVVITPYFNASEYIEKCIFSVISQDYERYTLILIDDASTDDSYNKVSDIISNLPIELRSKIINVHNQTNKGALFNQCKTIKNKCSEDDIVMLLDGDDWLYPRNDIFTMYNNIFHEGYDFSYGSCWSIVDNIPLIAQPYSKAIKEGKNFKDQRFNWDIPYTHLRLFKKSLFDNVDIDVFQDKDGNWLKAGGDVPFFYTIIGQAKKIKVIQDIVCMYNDANPINDYKVNSEEQTKNAKSQFISVGKSLVNYARNENKKIIHPNNPQRILIAIPTAKYVETATMKSIYDLDVPEGYDTDLQFFYGYNIDQVRNLIADWALKYDYLFSVDSDIILPNDSLNKLIGHDKDIVSGIYRQRKNEHILEIYDTNPFGGVINKPYWQIKDKGLVEIAACGFGCVLIKSDVIKGIGYPQFVYKSAIDHKDTISEDIYFCGKARKLGYSVWVDSSILCSHIGNTTFEV